MQYAPNIALPPQMVSLAKKNADNGKWKKETVDRVHQIGKEIIQRNLHMLENYQIIRGKFFYHHYLEDEGYRDMLDAMQHEFSIPKHLRHYDIIGKVINVMVNEMMKRPDVFKAQAMDEFASNNFKREKSRLILEWALNEVNMDVNMQLVKMGLDPEKEDFESEEEMQAYQEAVQQQRQILTPKEIENYMNTDWMDAAEEWANNQMAADNQRFHRKEMDRTEFEDLLTVARCFRHFYLRGSNYGEETWNPVTTFFHTSPDIEWVQEGDYVGRNVFMSPSAIINRWGNKMNEETIRHLEAMDQQTYAPGRANTATFRPEPYVVPYDNFETDQRLYNLAGVDIHAIQEVPDSEMFGSAYHINNSGLIEVCEGYWQSFRKVALVIYRDPEDGMVKDQWVDETFIAPKWLRQIEVEDLDYEEDLTNTITWTWVPEVWKFVKIATGSTRLKEDIYIDVNSNDFQFKGDTKMYGALLPVCGRIINNRNSDPMSVVDLMKPHQIGHNVAMNQGYEIMQREIGRFMLFDPNFLPMWKDWAGENGLEKLMLIAKSLGVAPADASAAATKGASNFAHFQTIDLDESARMLSRIKIAEFFEQRALSQIGITPQRMGDVAASETAQGTQTATAQSYAATESWFAKFTEYKQRCLTMGLQLAQYVQANELDGTISYIKSDLSRAFIKFVGTDLMLADFFVFVHDSQELMRQLEVGRNLAINNPNTGVNAMDLWTMATSNSPSEIRNTLQKSVEQRQQLEQRSNDIAQQQIAATAEENEKERAHELELEQMGNDTELEKTYIQTFGFNQNNTLDSDNNQVPDMLEYDKLNAKAAAEGNAMQLQQRKQASDERYNAQKMDIENKKIRQKDREMKSKERMKKIDQFIAIKNKNSMDKPSKTTKKK